MHLFVCVCVCVCVCVYMCAYPQVSSLTSSPEMLHGRVKTLHPLIHGGLLAVRGNADDERDVATHSIPLIDVVVVNLYPFAQTVREYGDAFERCVENVDIGGPAMIRSASKNHAYVSVLTSHTQYDAFIHELNEKKGSVSYNTRRKLAAAAFALTHMYDGEIAQYFKSVVDKQ